MKKEIGIWLDNDKAYVMDIDNSSSFRTINSKVEDYNIHGGSGSSIPHGPQDSVSESKLLERKKQQFSDYYAKIISHLSKVKSIAIFGPAEAKLGLAKELESHPSFQGKVVAVKPADSMTENQIKALLLSFYKDEE